MHSCQQGRDDRKDEKDDGCTAIISGRVTENQEHHVCAAIISGQITEKVENTMCPHDVS